MGQAKKDTIYRQVEEQGTITVLNKLHSKAQGSAIVRQKAGRNPVGMAGESHCGRQEERKGGEG